MSFIREHIVKNYQSYAPKWAGGKRSSKWPKIRKEHIRMEPTCAACGKTKKLQVHHIKDFSSNRKLELDHNNLMTLCMSGTRCHFVWGHLGYWKSINPVVIEDAFNFREKVENRR